jgi:hypothetical protein
MFVLLKNLIVFYLIFVFLKFKKVISSIAISEVAIKTPEFFPISFKIILSFPYFSIIPYFS